VGFKFGDLGGAPSRGNRHEGRSIRRIPTRALCAPSEWFIRIMLAIKINQGVYIQLVDAIKTNKTAPRREEPSPQG
jgi:hypothetical protein